nr:putative F-box/LRR-repeat protein 23 [Ipomoea batatas]
MANPADRAAPWVDLPRDLTANILQRLNVEDIFQSAQVCSAWWRICQDPSMWRYVNLWFIAGKDRDWDKICREVVNRSEGQLISIQLGHFATDDLLLFIAQRAKQLRHLGIFWYNRVSDEGNMHRLKHLRLDGNQLTDKGVEAILDACSSLQSLNLKHCKYATLGGELGKRCSQQIKDLTHIHDPAAYLSDFFIDFVLRDPDKYYEMYLDAVARVGRLAKQLRRLYICSGNVSDEGFSKAVNEFPLLEELQLECFDISKVGIEAAGQSCPFLISFVFIKVSEDRSEPSDEEAVAVAQNMHGLKHLILYGNEMTDKGVEAILDACPSLQFFDMEYCLHVKLEGELGNRFSQQIKDLNYINHTPHAFSDEDDLLQCLPDDLVERKKTKEIEVQICNTWKSGIMDRGIIRTYFKEANANPVG